MDHKPAHDKRAHDQGADSEGSRSASADGGHAGRSANLYSRLRAAWIGSWIAAWDSSSIKDLGKEGVGGASGFG